MADRRYSQEWWAEMKKKHERQQAMRDSGMVPDDPHDMRPFEFQAAKRAYYMETAHKPQNAPRNGNVNNTLGSPHYYNEYYDRMVTQKQNNGNQKQMVNQQQNTNQKQKFDQQQNGNPISNDKNNEDYPDQEHKRTVFYRLAIFISVICVFAALCIGIFFLFFNEVSSSSSRAPTESPPSYPHTPTATPKPTPEPTPSPVHPCKLSELGLEDEDWTNDALIGDKIAKFKKDAEADEENEDYAFILYSPADDDADEEEIIYTKGVFELYGDLCKDTDIEWEYDGIEFAGSISVEPGDKEFTIEDEDDEEPYEYEFTIAVEQECSIENLKLAENGIEFFGGKDADENLFTFEEDDDKNDLTWKLMMDGTEYGSGTFKPETVGKPGAITAGDKFCESAFSKDGKKKAETLWIPFSADQVAAKVYITDKDGKELEMTLLNKCSLDYLKLAAGDVQYTPGDGDLFKFEQGTSDQNNCKMEKFNDHGQWEDVGKVTFDGTTGNPLEDKTYDYCVGIVESEDEKKIYVKKEEEDREDPVQEFYYGDTKEPYILTECLSDNLELTKDGARFTNTNATGGNHVYEFSKDGTNGMKWHLMMDGADYASGIFKAEAVQCKKIDADAEYCESAFPVSKDGKKEAETLWIPFFADKTDVATIYIEYANETIITLSTTQRCDFVELGLSTSALFSDLTPNEYKFSIDTDNEWKLAKAGTTVFGGNFLTDKTNPGPLDSLQDEAKIPDDLDEADKYCMGTINQARGFIAVPLNDEDKFDAEKEILFLPTRGLGELTPSEIIRQPKCTIDILDIEDEFVVSGQEDIYEFKNLPGDQTKRELTKDGATVVFELEFQDSEPEKLDVGHRCTGKVNVKRPSTGKPASGTIWVPVKNEGVGKKWVYNDTGTGQIQFWSGNVALIPNRIIIKADKRRRSLEFLQSNSYVSIYSPVLCAMMIAALTMLWQTTFRVKK